MIKFNFNMSSYTTARPGMKLLLSIIIYFTVNISHAEMLGDWLAKNEPLVINYISKLKPGEDVLKGAELTDGAKYLEGYVYLGSVHSFGRMTQIHLFKKSNDLMAIIWLMSGAKPLALPSCPEGSEKAKFPWYSGAGLSGDIYTYPDVHAGHGIVVTMCPSQEWLNAVMLNKSKDSECKVINGEFKVWNGWQPSLRLTDSKSGITYGVTDDRKLPSNMVLNIKNNKPMIGGFCLSELGKVTSVPYQDNKIILVDIIKYEPLN